MRPFHDIFTMAADRHGGPAALEALLPAPRTRAELVATPDDRWLSAAARLVFSAGFNWSVVEKKWPGFETAFHGFAPGRVALMDDEEIEKAAKAGGIPHMPKALAIRDNAVLFQELAAEAGSAAVFLTDWPTADLAGLLALLKARGGRLGGTSAQYFLRVMGVDGYVLSRDVSAALVREGVVDRPPTGAKAMAATQAAFNHWSAESGRPLMQVSRILALSVG